MTIGAVVDQALVSGRTEMLIQALELAEFPMAQVAFVRVTVPGGSSGGCLQEVLAVPFQLLLCDETIGIALADDFVDALAVE